MAFLIGAAGGVVCSVHIDALRAQWAHPHSGRPSPVFHGLQALADGLLLLTPVALLIVGWRRDRGRTAGWDQVALQAALGVGLVSLLKYPLKFAFGRTWPATFHENHRSLLHDGVYGFYPSQGGVAHSAFPSGHAAVAATVIWHTDPRYWALAVLLERAVAGGLLGAYDHFAGDTLTGAGLGVFVASLVICFGDRTPAKETETHD